MGVLGILLRQRDQRRRIAILLVTLSGFAQPPSSVSRAVLLQRHTPARGSRPGLLGLLRDARRDLPDRHGRCRTRRHPGYRHPCCSSSGRRFCCSCRRRSRWWRRALGSGRGARPRRASHRPWGHRSMAALPVRLATLADFERLIGRLPTFARLSGDQREAFVSAATVRDVPGRDPHPGARRRGLGRVLHPRGDDERRRARRRRSLSRPERRWRPATSSARSRRSPAAPARPTSSPTRTSVLLSVPADALRATMEVPEIHRLVFSTLTSRLLQHRGGRPAAPGRPRPGGTARPAHAAAERRGTAALLRRGRRRPEVSAT